jgi:hypothetical protein
MGYRVDTDSTLYLDRSQSTRSRARRECLIHGELHENVVVLQKKGYIQLYTQVMR